MDVKGDKENELRAYVGTYHLNYYNVRDANSTFSKKHITCATFSICNYNFLIDYRPLCIRSKNCTKR